MNNKKIKVTLLYSGELDPDFVTNLKVDADELYVHDISYDETSEDASYVSNLYHANDIFESINLSQIVAAIVNDPGKIIRDKEMMGYVAVAEMCNSLQGRKVLILRNNFEQSYVWIRKAIVDMRNHTRD